ncbi:hypothetical protein N431DRAFT_215504 [Stipitochalara longipes BDJ]|nr:hypothetical protein N431DRAFT_215504 [Stipitochalara longipes BDJ]
MNPSFSGYSNEYIGYSWPASFNGSLPTAFDRVDQSLNRSTPNESSFAAIEAPSQLPVNIDDGFHTRRCSHSGCQDTRIFKQISAFKEHMDKHTRPCKCPVTGCNVKDFSNAGDLRRHRREVHTSPAFSCPFASCKRHQKGFGRKDNLIQRLKRTHGEDTIDSSIAQNSIPNGNGEAINSPDGGSCMGSDSGDSARDEIELVASKPTDKASLTAKLQELQALKEEAIAKFDGDIAALKRVLSFM